MTAAACASSCDSPSELAHLAGVRRRAAGHDATTDLVSVVHGADRIARVAHDLQLHATVRVQAIVKPPFAAAGALDAVERAKLHDGVEFHVLYDRHALATDDQLDRALALTEHGEVARVGSGLPLKLMIVDGETALAPLTTAADTVRRALLVRGPALVAALGNVFDDLWRAARPLSGATDDDVLVPTDQDRVVLSLLASGATDETIGRMMGASPRTAHRRVRDLMARLGVQTRFQAGVRAVRLGWL